MQWSTHWFPKAVYKPILLLICFSCLECPFPSTPFTQTLPMLSVSTQVRLSQPVPTEQATSHCFLLMALFIHLALNHRALPHLNIHLHTGSTEKAGVCYSSHTTVGMRLVRGSGFSLWPSHSLVVGQWTNHTPLGTLLSTSAKEGSTVTTTSQLTKYNSVGKCFFFFTKLTATEMLYVLYIDKPMQSQ